MIKIFYNLTSQIAALGLHLVGVFSARIRKFNQSRKAHREYPVLKESVLFHCASLGEYEESRPLIDYISRRYPTLPIVISFFSDSGFEPIHNKQNAYHVVYLPMDGFGYYKEFLDGLKPKIVIISKYEFWPGLLEGCHSKEIPVLHINTILRPNHRLFRWPLSSMPDLLQQVNHYFVMNEETQDILHAHDIHQVKISGDLRMNRSMAVAKKAIENPNLHIQSSKPIIVFGSTWPIDEKWCIPFIQQHPEYQYILAPHDISKTHIDAITAQLPDVVKLSEYTHQSNWNCLLVDSIGQLKELYALAEIAYIGGAIQHKIHNFLEASAYYIPVCFGPQHQNMPMAQEFVNHGFARIVDSYDLFASTLVDFRFNDSEKKAIQATFEELQKGLQSIENHIDELLAQNRH